MVKEKIGVAIAGKQNVIGPIVTTIVTVPLKFLRIATTPVSMIRLSQYLEFLHTEILPAKDIKNFSDEDEVKMFLTCLNMQQMFWRYPINITTEVARDNFFEHFGKHMPQNLLYEKLNEDNWSISPTTTKFTRIASNFANYFLMKELEEIKMVHGDFGTGRVDDPLTQEFVKNNPECIHIRRNEE